MLQSLANGIMSNFRSHMKSFRSWICVAVCAAFSTWSNCASASALDLKPHWDDRAPLRNPHKGWYHHFPDNHINKYVIARDADLLEFPGMDHLYIRLAWAYLEPTEGQFNWAVIDDLIKKWTNHGLGISFRISCKETSTDRVEQQFATPKWVMEAGAKGGYYRAGKPAGPDAPWEPEFDDPVFLEKLEHFLLAFAARYDGQPWLRYLDVGSIGDWGEGHTWAGSRKKYGFDTRKLHVDLHLKYFRKTQLIISDDFVYETGAPDERRRMHEYVISHDIGYRDDSILVDGYFAGYSATATVRSPELFTAAWQRLPAVLELEHYSAVKRSGNWDARPGSSLARHGNGKTGPEMLREALGLLRATYIGYHGDAAVWLADNPELTVELLNLSGYWYFLHRIAVPDAFVPGAPHVAEMTWENRGVAPAFEDFELQLRVEGPETFDFTFPSGNRRWLPASDEKTYSEKHTLTLPRSAEPGTYRLKLKLRSPKANRDVLLALKPGLLDVLGYYDLGQVRVVARP